jgi:glutamyl-Q tRNA(Asp) synthetase
VSAANASTATATIGTADLTGSGSPGTGGEPYCGRFAPSPTGDLHSGSLLTATGSYLAARSRHGRWLVRMEDVDRAREVPGAADRILRTLDCFGFEWDGLVVRQSDRLGLYEAALQRLKREERVYGCTCTRAELARLPRTSDDEAVYPGLCRKGARPSSLPPALRFLTGTTGHETVFEDALQGRFAQDVAAQVGDFIVRRRDGYHAYQLAVVVDDAEQGITEVVRGCDLLDNTPRQILLQRALGLPTPGYCHLPVVAESDGSKLSKRERSVPLDPSRAPEMLHRTLQLLGQSPPDDLASASLATLWAWAVENWRISSLRGQAVVPY